MSRSTSAVTSSPFAFRILLGLALLITASSSVRAHDTVTGASELTVTDSQTSNPFLDADVDILVNGVQLSAPGRLNTGQPFTVNSLFDVHLYGTLTDRLANTNGSKRSEDAQQPLIAAGPSPQMLAPAGSDGRVGRNAFQADRTVFLDVAASKQTSFTTCPALSVGFEVFNFLNRNNCGIPAHYLEALAFTTSYQHTYFIASGSVPFEVQLLI